jgi:cell division protein FtsI/penicillin-binding protein 2
MVFMDLNRQGKLLLFTLFCSGILTLSNARANFNFIKDNTFFSTPSLLVKPQSSEDFTKILSQHQSWNEQLDYDSSKYKVSYTFNPALEEFIKRQLSLYHPDYTSIVVIDNDNGHILAAVDYARQKNIFGRDLAFTNTHPAASIFKVITAADLLENTHIKTDTEFSFTGRSTTLYRHQLKEPPQSRRRQRWLRTLDLQKAFATSNNVIFGRSAIENLTPAGLKKMAEKFGFNKRLVEGINLEPSVFSMASDQYNLAEFSSGLNDKTLMSPVHGAVIGSIIANGGILRYPVVIKSLEGLNDKKIIYPPLKRDEAVLTPRSSEDLRILFQATVTQGTARASFRRSRSLLEKLEIGGKTGSLTGGEPYGKRDWFVSYAKSLEDKNDRGISICVMIVNQKRWYVKSSLIAKNIIEYYYSNMSSYKK